MMPMANSTRYTPAAFAALSSDEMRTYAPEFAKHVDKSTLDLMYHKKFKREQVTTALVQRDHSLRAGAVFRGSLKPGYDRWLAVQNDAMDKVRRGNQLLEEGRRQLGDASAMLSDYNQSYQQSFRNDEAYEGVVELAHCSIPPLPLFRKGAGPSTVEPTTPMHDPDGYEATYASAPFGPPFATAAAHADAFLASMVPPASPLYSPTEPGPYCDWFYGDRLGPMPIEAAYSPAGDGAPAYDPTSPRYTTTVGTSDLDSFALPPPVDAEPDPDYALAPAALAPAAASAVSSPDDVEDEEDDEPTTLLDATGLTVAQLAHVSNELHDKFAHQWQVTSTWTKLLTDDLNEMFADELVIVYGPNHASDPLDFLVAYGYPHKHPVANRVDLRLWHGDPSTAKQAGLRKKFTEGPASARKLCHFLDVGAALPLAFLAPAPGPFPLAHVAAAAVGAAMQAVVAAAGPPHGVPVVAGGLVKRAALLAAEPPIAKIARREAGVEAIDDPSPSYVPH